MSRSLYATGQWLIGRQKKSPCGPTLATAKTPRSTASRAIVGWTADYEQIGSGSEPERTVWNQLMRELTGVRGRPSHHGYRHLGQRAVSYQHPAFAASDQGLHVSLENTGPNFGNATDPTEAGQTVWRLY